MKQTILFIICLLFGFNMLCAQPKFEVRAAWLTTAYGMDWPRTKIRSTADIKKQKQELITILDQLQEAHINTILFQARTRGEVFYKSNIEPFDSELTGKKNDNPGYDPLAFVIEECHKRGMECHAWLIAIPLGNQNHVRSLGNSSVTKKRPSICVNYNRQYFLNPGHPETKVYLMSIVDEIIKNYDIDGIHFDYLRYPERATRFPDQKEYRQYGKGLSLDQWRKESITAIVRHVYQNVKAKKPWVKVSTSPVGKLKDTPRYSSKGWNAHDVVHQDVNQWLKEGIQDQIYPMMYFRGNNFFPFALDWQERSNERQVIPGLGIYFLDPREGNWTLDEVERQLFFLRNHKLNGQAFYRTEFLINNTKDVFTLIKDEFYDYPALQPPMPWLKTDAPLPPQNLNAQYVNRGYLQLNWTPSLSAKEETVYYVVYGSNEYPVDCSKAQHIIAQRIPNEEYIYAPITPWEAVRFFAVTTIDRYGNESEPTQLSPTLYNDWWR